MEGREENSNVTAIPKKSRSLDLKSLYKSKLTEETPKKNLKRTGSSPVGVDEKRNKRKKARKEVSLSSLENADGSSKKVPDEECRKGASSGREDLRELKLGVSQGLSGSSGLNRVSLGGGDVCIPKRKRNFVGRKKSGVGQASHPVGHPSCKIGHGDQVPKLGSDGSDRGVETSKIKQKKYFDEFKENRSSDSNSVQNFKENGDHASHSVVNSGDTSLTKSQKKNRKRKALASDRIRVAKEAEPLIDSCKISDDLQEDDEENLEENAARMLSSRFDPSCTGFSSSSKSSPLPSANGLSFLLSSSRNIGNRGSKSRSGSESASVDTAGRTLRPRKQFKDKGDVDAYWVLNRRIKVFWPLDQSWYYGLVNDYNEEKRLHHIKYDDRDEEWVNLNTERFKLLLLRSEVPGNVKGGRALAKNKSSDQQNGNRSRKERQRREANVKDDSCGGSSMDSEPIISWLARSSNRLKSSSFHGIKKQKTSVTLPSTTSSLLYDEPVTVKGHTAKSSFGGVKNNLSSDSVSQDKLGDDFREKSSLQSATRTKDGKQPIVYFRRRFRRPAPISPNMPEKNQVITSEPCSISFDHVVGGVENVKESGDRRVKIEGPLWFTYNEGVSKTFWDLESASFKFNFNFPIRLVLNEAFQSKNLWLLNTVLMLQSGTVMTKWPRVCLEMLFVDNVVGLRIFRQPAHRGKYDLQLPFTSIGFKFSSLHVIKKPLVFAFYNFSRLKNSKWVHLDSKLKRHCLLSKQLHLSECTYDNIQALQNGSSEFTMTSISDPSSVKVMRRRSRPGINIMGVSKVSTQVGTQSSDAGERKLPPLALSFAAAPTFFVCLHLKLLMDQSAAHMNFYNHAPIDEQEDSGLVTDDCSSIDDCSIRNSEIILRKDVMTLSNDAAGDGWACAELDQATGPSTCSDQVLSQNFQNIGLNGAGTSISHGSERLGTVHLPEWQSHHSELELGSLPSSSLINQDKADDGSHSFMTGLDVQIPTIDEFEKPSAQNSPDFSWNINGGGVIPSSNPTAPRSSWHRSRNSSLSLGFQSHGWSDGKADSLYNDFSNGPKKPRTQVSYSVPFAGYECSSRNRSHNQKGLSHKRIRKASEKKSSDVARGPEKNFECLSCDANVLITLGDKGWRESGAHVVLELFDHNEWKLSVKLLGITRYSYKAHQFMQPGSTNRFTHAMMWKGGKDWILEFPDRSQWALFKEMHEECYNRNIRAASVKNIPIPGVHLIEENDDNGSEVHFVRSCKYFQQVETDVEMALDPSRVLYDMDSEDEQWISNIRNSEKTNCDLNGITEEMFEKTMDMFEKAAYAQLRNQFTPNEIEELMVNVAPLCVVKVIYDHWQQRRQKKGMALIRHFQPPLWERYQQQVKEWENNNLSSNGCLDKVATLEKPPMFAFCLKPRGLESQNKGLKHRSQKKISVSGHTNSIPDQDGFHTFGRRLNGSAFGDVKFVYPGHSYDSLDDSPLPQTSPRVFSPRDAGSMRYYSVSNDGYYRNHITKFHRSKSKKFGSFMYHNDSQMTASYSQRMSLSEKRNGVSRWNMGDYDIPGHRQYLLDGPQRHGIEQLDGSDQDEFRLRDASSAAQHALNMAKLKRERAQRLLYRADLAIHKAVVALMTAEAMKASEDSVGQE
ncbi:Enhancer of polycomb-like, N-terminal [Sesbania bispinosa]|nr:Enhancer of polycomb-like, N-terminal [Sesbania bispinosa]